MEQNEVKFGTLELAQHIGPFVPQESVYTCRVHVFHFMSNQGHFAFKCQH